MTRRQDTTKELNWLNKWIPNEIRLPILVILVITGIVFFPALSNSFTNWDDGLYVTQNPYIQGFSIENLKTIFTEPIANNYHPLTMISLTFNYIFGKLNPSGYHSTNLFLHLANTFFVFLFAYHLTDKRLWVGIITALFFGIHPMHVESVAWVSERKDVLYTFFFVSGLLSYLAYLKNEKTKYLGVTLILCLLSLLSKPAAVVFPIVLLLVDYYKNREWSGKVFLEKIPFFALSIVFGVITLNIQSSTAIGEFSQFSFIQRISFACYGIVAYLTKLVLPLNLSALYPYPVQSATESLPAIYMVTPIFVLGIIGAAIWGIRKHKWLTFGLLFFLVNIALVLQFVTVGNAIIADRYTYLSYVGIFLIIGIGVDTILQKPNFKKWRIPALGIIGALSIMYSALSFQRCAVWKNSITLWTDAIKKDNQNFLAFTKRGEHYYNNKDAKKALDNFDKAIAIQPNYALPYTYKGFIFLSTKNYDKALPSYTKAIELSPNNADFYNQRGRCYYETNEWAKAIEDYKQAITLNPNAYKAYNNRAIIYHRNQEYEKALADYDAALKINPNYPSATQNRATLLNEMGN